MVKIEDGKILVSMNFFDNVRKSQQVFDFSKISETDTFALYIDESKFVFLFNCRWIPSPDNPQVKMAISKRVVYKLPEFKEEDEKEIDHHIYIRPRKNGEYHRILHSYAGKPCKLIFNGLRDGIVFGK